MSNGILKVGFLGGGKMASALASGFIQSGHFISLLIDLSLLINDFKIFLM